MDKYVSFYDDVNCYAGMVPALEYVWKYKGAILLYIHFNWETKPKYALSTNINEITPNTF